jgi:hypothetical protein
MEYILVVVAVNHEWPLTTHEKQRSTRPRALTAFARNQVVLTCCATAP